MKGTLRGRPRLNLKLEEILKAVRHHSQVVGAARQLGCSPSYVHARLKEAGIPLGELLENTESTASLREKPESSGRGTW